MNFPLLVLLLVFVLIAARRVGRWPIAIWQALGLGALAVLMAGSITPRQAFAAVDWNIMLFLFAMFVLGRGLVASGLLYQLAYALFSRTVSTDALLLLIIFTAGCGSAVLMNDTLAIIGTPLMLKLAAEHQLRPKLLLLALCFAITTGSVMSPIGNPQNLLIAVRGDFVAPFVSFLDALLIPTLLSLLLVYAVLKWYYRADFHAGALLHRPPAPLEPRLAWLSGLGLLLVIVLIVVQIGTHALGLQLRLPLGLIALAGAGPLLLFSGRRVALVRAIDWSTLVFFVALFVLMEAVWLSGFFQTWLGTLDWDPTALPAVLAVSILLSQLISNVPLVALYMPVLTTAGAGPDMLLALAAGSTIAGNLLILGAASNVIVIQNAERHGATLGFIEFARVGIPLTVLQTGVYWLWLGG